MTEWINPNYKFQAFPKFWDQSCHKWPTPETDRIDAMLNELSETLILLSAGEFQQALQLAEKRNQAAGKNQNLKVSTQSDLSIHLVGACGELATFKFLGLYWRPTVNTYKAADLPHNIEVRTRTENRYDLKIRQSDPDDRRCVLAFCPSVIQPVRVRLAGWITAGEAKKISPVIDPRNANQPFYATPEHLLHPMRELKTLIKLSEP